MSDLICVTNRHLCREDYFVRLEHLAEAKPKAILLREKDLSPAEYKSLAKQALDICEKHGTQLILHTFPEVATALGHHALHCPLPVLRNLQGTFSILGASCHSVEDAKEARALGCTYITAGHVFDTDCKKGLPGRGLAFLEEVCKAVDIPVYAIGGITPDNIQAVRSVGAAGACIMGSAMQCDNPKVYLSRLEEQP